VIKTETLGLLGSLKKLAKSRISMLFAFTASAALGTLIAGKGFPPIIPTILAIVSTLFITLSVYLYNDIIDLEMDKESKSINKEDRPLVTGEVSVKNTVIIIAVSSIIGLSISWLINPVTFVIALSYWVIFALYSFPSIRFKRIFVVKTLITSLGPALTLLLGMSSVLGKVYPLGLFTAFIQWGFLFLMLPSLADSFDLEEDSKYGMKTMGMVFSWKTKTRMLLFAPILATIASLIGLYVFNLSPVFPVLSVASSVLFGKSIIKIMNEYQEEEVWKVRKLGFIYYDLNLIFVLLGTLNFGSMLALF